MREPVGVELSYSVLRPGRRCQRRSRWRRWADRIQRDGRRPEIARACAARRLCDDRLDPRQLPERGSRHGDAAVVRSTRRSSTTTCRSTRRSRSTSRIRSKAIPARDVHGPMARGRPAAAGLDDRGDLARMQVVGVVLVHNEDVFVEQAIRTSRRSATGSTPSTISRPTGRPRSSAASHELDHVTVERSSDAGDSHRVLEALRRTSTWRSASTATSSTILRLSRLRADLDAGTRGRFPSQGPRPELRRAGRSAGSGQGLPRAAFPTGDQALQHGRRRELDGVPRAAARRRRGVSQRLRLGVAPVPLRGHRLGHGSAADAAHVLPPAFDQ